jgi:hypothetical protein
METSQRRFLIERLKNANLFNYSIKLFSKEWKVVYMAISSNPDCLYKVYLKRAVKGSKKEYVFEI